METKPFDSTMTNWEEMADPNVGQQASQPQRPPKEIIPMDGPKPKSFQGGSGKPVGPSAKPSPIRQLKRMPMKQGKPMQKIAPIPLNRKINAY